MGGDGQPQTQAAVFTRYAVFNHDGSLAELKVGGGKEGGWVVGFGGGGGEWGIKVSDRNCLIAQGLLTCLL